MEITINVEEKINSTFHGSFDIEELEKTEYATIKEYIASLLYAGVDLHDDYSDEVIDWLERQEVDDGDIVRTYQDTLEVEIGEEE